MLWFANLCHGWPRSKQNSGDWMDVTKSYIWEVGLHVSQGDTRLPSKPTFPSISPCFQFSHPWVPLCTYTHGYSVSCVGGDPGCVAVYWKGGPEAEIIDVKEFTDENKLQENGFVEESFSWPPDKGATAPLELKDKGN